MRFARFSGVANLSVSSGFSPYSLLNSSAIFWSTLRCVKSAEYTTLAKVSSEDSALLNLKSLRVDTFGWPVTATLFFLTASSAPPVCAFFARTSDVHMPSASVMALPPSESSKRYPSMGAGSVEVFFHLGR